MYELVHNGHHDPSSTALFYETVTEQFRRHGADEVSCVKNVGTRQRPCYFIMDECGGDIEHLLRQGSLDLRRTTQENPLKDLETVMVSSAEAADRLGLKARDIGRVIQYARDQKFPLKMMYEATRSLFKYMDVVKIVHRMRGEKLLR